MKRLNSKGFTLVELLAVIIILAVVVGITIPAVLTTTNNAKVRAGKNAAQSVADWIDRQYQVVSTGLVGTGIAEADPAFIANTGCGSDGSSCTGDNANPINDKSFILASGVSTANVESIAVRINPSTGRSCVELTIGTKSDYYFGGVTTCVTGEVNCYKSATVIQGGSC